jgi:hypothetical protein
METMTLLWSDVCVDVLEATSTMALIRIIEDLIAKPRETDIYAPADFFCFFFLMTNLLFLDWSYRR